MTTDTLDIRYRAYEHRRHTLISNLLELQARLHNDLAARIRANSPSPSLSRDEIKADLSASDLLLETIRHTYNPYTPVTAQLADAGNIERSES